MRDAHDSLQIKESFHVDLVMTQEFGIVGEIPQKPAEFPECLFGAVQPPIKGLLLQVLWLQNDQSEFQKWFFRLPAKERPIDTNEEQPLE